MATNASYKWDFIRDYEIPPDALAKPELLSLAEVWAEQRQVLEESEGLQTFNERLHREWAIETGLLERIYTLDRGVTQMLIERGIDAALIPDGGGAQDPNRVVAIIRDHEAAIEGLFSFVRGERKLTPSYIKELHAQLTRNQPSVTAIDSLGNVIEVDLVRGDFKRQPNNPRRPDGGLHEYCPPEQVAGEIERLIQQHESHQGVSPEVEAAWLHHRFTQIHPFQDGNGRVARCLATLVFLRAGWFPLVIRDIRQERARYLDALEEADHGELSALVGVFAAAQKRAFVQALGISGQVLRLTRAEQIIAATRDLLIERERSKRAEWERAKVVAQVIQRQGRDRLEEIARGLSSATRGYLDDARFFVDSESNGGQRSHYFRWQIIETAKQLDYYANTAEYRAWLRLVLRTETQAEILVSFHGTGFEYRGILAVSACFFRREVTEEGEREVQDVTPLSSEIFQINYRERENDASARFRDWLEDVLVKGLELWRAGL
jgi:Fic family protein